VAGYRLLGRIGEGGMGVVHLAEAPDGRRVALKVLRPHVVGDDESRARLAREVASLRRVAGPRVAEVLDADPWGELPFVATRYVPGPSLHEHVRRVGPLRGPDLVHVAATLAEALVAVHSVGVLHRDVKPSNVLLEGRDPVLIDFGLARVAEDARLTHTGWLLGTPGYFAPEILFGQDATTASDVHSWAATVVFAATGRPPYGTGPAVAVMDRVRRGEHDLSAVPGGLLPLLTACLAGDPAERPSTGAVLAALREPGSSATRPRSPGVPSAPRPPGDRPWTRPLTVAAPRSRPLTLDESRPAPAPASTPPASASPRARRGALLGALFAAVTVAFALAPYLCLLVLTPLALLVRTASWTAESARERRQLRGGRRWYDPLLTVASAPWYLVVAAGGTLVLMVWSALAAFVTGVAYLLFRGPLEPGLVLMGAVLSTSLWWGPGSRRLRVPTRRLMRALTRRSWSGWLAVAVLAALTVLGLVLLHSGGVVWDPRPGAPWRPGTLLGALVRWF
jgi:predicted Ser/Thr protein kinase